MFDWNDLKIFLAAYREGSIGRAAEALGMSGSTVSRRLSALEEAVGQTLFVRTPEGLLPTDAGQQARSAAEDTERSATLVETLLGAEDAPRGTVRLSASTELLHMIIIPAWPEFSRRYPEISVAMVESTNVVDLERWEADLAVRTVRPKASDSLVITTLRETRVGLFAARSLLRERGIDADDGEALAAVAAGAWAEWPWVDWSEDRVHLSLARLRQHLYPEARVVLRATSLESMRLACAAGVGLLLLPSFYGRVTRGLVRLPASGLPGPRPLYMVGHRATRRTARVAAVWDHLVDLLRGEDDRDLVRVQTSLAAAYGIDYGIDYDG